MFMNFAMLVWHLIYVFMNFYFFLEGGGLNYFAIAFYSAMI